MTVVDVSRYVACISVNGGFIVPANGELSRKFGVYKTLCCDAEIVIGVGVAFPDCPNHANLPTDWKELPDVDPNNLRIQIEENL